MIIMDIVPIGIREKKNDQEKRGIEIGINAERTRKSRVLSAQHILIFGVNSVPCVRHSSLLNPQNLPSKAQLHRLWS
jgi:hypothetical protein